MANWLALVEIRRVLSSRKINFTIIQRIGGMVNEN
jgi:hypothetical protein